MTIGAGLTPPPTRKAGRAVVRAALLLLAADALSGCHRAYHQDIAASQYFPDEAYGQGRAAFRTQPSAYAPPQLPLTLRPVFTPGP